eukprot:scaffold10868_cov121-Isochrysis_galbana.AAC.8
MHRLDPAGRLLELAPMRSPAFLLLALVVPTGALEARWTPASDGGPARFSKRHRDAAGIDDSRWAQTDEQAVSYTGLFLALGLAAVGAYVLYQDRRQSPAGDGGRLGGAPAPAMAGSAATAADARRAREKFLADKFPAPGATTAPQSWNDQLG